jgi:hypothetical protein
MKQPTRQFIRTDTRTGWHDYLSTDIKKYLLVTYADIKLKIKSKKYSKLLRIPDYILHKQHK